MKALELQKTGYSDKSLENLFRSTLFPSSFFDKPELVRGVCFASGAESVQLAQSFAQNELGLGTVTLHLETTRYTDWKDLVRGITPPIGEVANVGIVLPALDLVSEKYQAKISDTILSGGDALWFPTVSDQRRLIPSLKLALLVYLGLGPNERMRFLVQAGQQVVVDEGSLRRKPRPKG